MLRGRRRWSFGRAIMTSPRGGLPHVTATYPQFSAGVRSLARAWRHGCLTTLSPIDPQLTRDHVPAWADTPGAGVHADCGPRGWRCTDRHRRAGPFFCPGRRDAHRAPLQTPAAWLRLRGTTSMTTDRIWPREMASIDPAVASEQIARAARPIWAPQRRRRCLPLGRWGDTVLSARRRNVSRAVGALCRLGRLYARCRLGVLLKMF